MISIRHLPSHKLVRLANATVAWGVLFAVVHFYWAAGGTALHNSGATDAAAQAYIGFIAVIGLVSAAVAHGLRARLGRAPQPPAAHAPDPSRRSRPCARRRGRRARPVCVNELDTGRRDGQ
jgi:hypothetical protein